MKPSVTEGIKYGATALNNIGVASIVTGGIGPLVASELGTVRVANPTTLTLLCASWIAVGIGFIFGAQAMLRMLR